MQMEKIEQIIDSNLTKKLARIDLEEQKIVVKYYKNKQNGDSVVHSHPYHEFVLPITGSEVRYSANGGLYDVGLGDMIYFPTEMYHSGKFNVTGNISERLVVKINDNLWKDASQMLDTAQTSWMNGMVILERDAVTYWNIRGVFDKIAQSVKAENEFRDKLLLTYVMELQLLIGQIIATEQIEMPGAQNELVTRAVNYLQEHYEEPDLTVTKLAKENFTSREHLSRVFKEYTMESIHNYLTNLRMQNCRRILAEGGTVEDACNQSGFSNYTSFLKAFQHRYGMSPSEYKKSARVIERTTK